jgi:hypothetical protein
MRIVADFELEDIFNLKFSAGIQIAAKLHIERVFVA